MDGKHEVFIGKMATQTSPVDAVRGFLVSNGNSRVLGCLMSLYVMIVWFQTGCGAPLPATTATIETLTHFYFAGPRPKIQTARYAGGR